MRSAFGQVWRGRLWSILQQACVLSAQKLTITKSMPISRSEVILDTCVYNSHWKGGSSGSFKFQFGIIYFEIYIFKTTTIIDPKTILTVSSHFALSLPSFHIIVSQWLHFSNRHCAFRYFIKKLCMKCINAIVIYVPCYLLTNMLRKNTFLRSHWHLLYFSPG